jgi:hypothetical protein
MEQVEASIARVEVEFLHRLDEVALGVDEWATTLA